MPTPIGFYRSALLAPPCCHMHRRVVVTLVALLAILAVGVSTEDHGAQLKTSGVIGDQVWTKDSSSVRAKTETFGWNAERPALDDVYRADAVSSLEMDQATKHGARSALTMRGIGLATGSTNATFVTLVCDGTIGSYDSLVVDSVDPVVFELPPCLATATSLLTMTLRIRLLVPSFALFPPSLQSLDLYNGIYGPGAVTTPTAAPSASPTPSAASDFDENGEIVWTQVWSTLPALTRLALHGANLKGPLPSSLPAGIVGFELTENAHPLGNIPPGLFSQYTTGAASFRCDLSGSGLTGTLPPGLFSSFAGQEYSDFQFVASNNALTGSLPPAWLYPLQSASSYFFRLDLSNNQLNGTLPPNLFLVGLLANRAVFSLRLAGNQIEGAIPASFLYNLTKLSSLDLSLSNNRLTGPLPSALLSSATWSLDDYSFLQVLLDHNAINGTIPPAFLTSSLRSGSNISFTAFFTLDLSSNQLSGSIPATILSNNGSYFQSTYDYFLNLADNKLTGTIPSRLLDAVVFQATSLVILTLDNNKLSGSFLDTSSIFLNSGLGTLRISAANNRLSGDVPTRCVGLSEASYDLYGNRLNGSILVTDLDGCQRLTLNVSMNIKLNSSIPSELFNVGRLVFDASYTNLTGPIPTSMLANPGAIDLSFTSIDFCSEPLVYSFSNGACNLDGTSASCDCPLNYSTCSGNCFAPMLLIAPYSDDEEPVAPPSPPPWISPPHPAPTSQSAPSGCDLKTRPSPEFVCVNGVWTATSTSRPVLTIPSGAGVVVVEGNVSSSTIVINGIGSKIIVGGCASNLSSVIIELSPEEVKQLESTKSLQTLLTLSGDSTSCTRNLSDVALNTRTSGCRKVSTEKVVSGNSIGAYFVVNSGGCNRWWIILVSVIAGVVVVAVVVAVIARVVWQKHRLNKANEKLAQLNG